MLTFENKLCNEQELQNYYYHWFWGICYGTHNKIPSIGEELFKIKNEDLLTKIKTKQETITNYHPIIRFIFWLFNIDNYTHNSYLLSANDSYERYQKFNLQFSKQENATMKLENVKPSNNFNTNDTLFNRFKNFIIDKWDNIFHYQSNWSDNEENKSNDETKSSQNYPDIKFFNEDDHFCMVTDYMLEHLQYMNIDKKVGEVITYGEVHSAYRRAARRCHPDKTGSREAWNNLEEHHNILKSMIVPDLSENDNIKFYADLNEIKIDIEEMQVFNQYLRGKINQFETQLSDIWKRIEEIERFERLSDMEKRAYVSRLKKPSDKSLSIVQSSAKGKEYPMYRMFSSNTVHNPIVNHQNHQQDSNDSQALVIYGMHKAN